VKSRRWNSSFKKPLRKGWYECKARDNRWDGKTMWRAWGNGLWWIPLKNGWLSSNLGTYKWRGPRKPLASSGDPHEEYLSLFLD